MNVPLNIFTAVLFVCRGCGARRPLVYDVTRTVDVTPCTCGIDRWTLRGSDQYAALAGLAMAEVYNSGATITPSVMKAEVEKKMRALPVPGEDPPEVTVGLRADGRFDVELRSPSYVTTP